MKILLTNKNTKKISIKSGEITSMDFYEGLTLRIRYSSCPNFFTELQELLLKYYEVEVISTRGEIRNKLLLPVIRQSHKPKIRGNSYHNIRSKRQEKAWKQ